MERPPPGHSKSASMAMPAAWRRVTPSLELRGAGAEADVAGSARAVRGHGERRLGRGRHDRRRGVEDQQHLPRKAEEDLAAGRLGVELQAEQVAVEGLRRVEVLGIEDGLEDPG